MDGESGFSVGDAPKLQSRCSTEHGEVPFVASQFEDALKTNTIESYSNFIRHNMIRCDGKCELIEQAASGIYRILTADFPRRFYSLNINYWDLSARLPEAIRKGEPLVLAFVSRQWQLPDVPSWTVHFAEIAGVSVRLKGMAPTVNAGAGGVWRAQGGDIEKPIDIAPFGRAEHVWSCYSGQWKNATVLLNYYGTYGAEKHFFKLHCQTTFPT